MTTEINVHEAKTHFSKLLNRVLAGEEIIIAKAGIPVARLVPIKNKANDRRAGSAKGKIVIQESFYEPLPAEVLEAFEGQ
jgi:prevent-host-death family protein